MKKLILWSFLTSILLPTLSGCTAIRVKGLDKPLETLAYAVNPGYVDRQDFRHDFIDVVRSEINRRLGTNTLTVAFYSADPYHKTEYVVVPCTYRLYGGWKVRAIEVFAEGRLEVHQVPVPTRPMPFSEYLLHVNGFIHFVDRRGRVSDREVVGWFSGPSLGFTTLRKRCARFQYLQLTIPETPHNSTDINLDNPLFMFYWKLWEESYISQGYENCNSAKWVRHYYSNLRPNLKPTIYAKRFVH